MEGLFQQFAAVSNDILLKEQRARSALFSLDFMKWIAEEESACDDEERKRQLGALAGRIMSLRSGVVPAAELDTTTIPEGDDEGEEEQSETEEALNVARQAWPGWPVKLTWNPEYEMAKKERIHNLKAAVKERRANAITEITGRARVEGASEEEMEARMAAVHAARRIAEYLVTIPDRTHRNSMLSDALTPPSSSASDPEEEASIPEPSQSSSQAERGDRPGVGGSIQDLQPVSPEQLIARPPGSWGLQQPINDLQYVSGIDPEDLEDLEGAEAFAQPPPRAARGYGGPDGGPDLMGSFDEGMEFRSVDQSDEAGDRVPWEDGGSGVDPELGAEEDELHATALQLLQVVKDMLTEVKQEKDSLVDRADRSGQPSGYTELPVDVAEVRLLEMKDDVLQAWSDSF